MASVYGFSLFEFLIVCLLVGILSIASLPSVSQLILQPQLLYETRALEQTLEGLNLRAQNGEQDIVLNAYRHYFEAYPTSSSGKPLVVRHLSKGVEFSHAVSPQSISLYASGAVSPRTLTLSAGQESCQVIISLRGRVRSTC